MTRGLIGNYQIRIWHEYFTEILWSITVEYCMKIMKADAFYTKLPMQSAAENSASGSDNGWLTWCIIPSTHNLIEYFDYLEIVHA